MLKAPEQCLYCRAEIYIPRDAAFVRCAHCGHIMEISSFTRADEALRAIIEEARAAMSESVEELQRQHAESQNLKMQMLFARGEALQRAGSFEEAARCYSEIALVNAYEAEVYWRRFLCRRGVEYVPDPRTGEFVPTLAHLCTESIPDDADYQAALKYARSENAREFYRQQAAKIGQTIERYIHLRDSEKDYDVFICVKQTDGHDNPTRDSQIAQELYYNLTSGHGLRVFNSLIVMPQHAGEEYEPYIMAALMSAKVMVVVSTSPENISSPWVRNEWRRYSWLCSSSDRPRKLIAYLYGMTAKELPSELGALQAIDGARLDATATLEKSILSHLGKESGAAILPTGKQKKTGKELVATSESLLRRASILLGDHNYSEAAHYFDRVLDAHPECARAYAGQLCIELDLPCEEALAFMSRQLFPIRGDSVLCPSCGGELSESRYGSCARCGHKFNRAQKLFKHALQYADGEYRKQLLGYAQASNLRIRFGELEGEYRTLKQALEECTAPDGSIVPELMQRPSKAAQMAGRCAELQRAIDLLGEVRAFGDVCDALQQASILMPAMEATLAEMRAFESTFAGKMYLLGCALKRVGCRLGNWLKGVFQRFGQWLLDILDAYWPFIVGTAIFITLVTLLIVWLIDTGIGHALILLALIGAVSSIKDELKK